MSGGGAGQVIIGIDPGLVKTGWGIIKKIGRDVTFLDCGVLITKPSERPDSRLLFIFNGMRRVIEDYNPTEAAIEEVFVNSNPNTSEKLIMARTAAYLSLAVAGLRITEFRPNEIKKNITGNGHAGKGLVSSMVRQILRIQQIGAIPADATDALAIALCLGFTAANLGK
jgi:crossover junction endodeoxyribonuclease RuvC